MANDYILTENDTLSSFDGATIHKILTYIEQNYGLFDKKISSFSAKLAGDSTSSTTTVLPKTGWQQKPNDIYEKSITIINIPDDFDYTNTDKVNFIISPTEDKGNFNNQFSEESSRVIYNDSMIRCQSSSFSSNSITLTFLADTIPEYNIYLNILVFYTPENNFNL